MGAKIIAVSADDITYYTLPGNSGELQREGAQLDDTIFGQTYKSNFPGIIQWQMNGNAVYKGYPGYACTIKKAGTTTAMSDEATTLVSGKTYQITNTAKRIIDRAVAVVVEDNAVDHTADVESIDFLFGKVTFKSTYTVTGAVTVTGSYFPVAAVGKANGYTLTMTAEATNNTDFPTAQANNGFSTFQPGLKTVSLELPGIFDATSDFQQMLMDRDELILELNPDGAGLSIARGFFRAVGDRQSGNVGALEEESVTFSLSVPQQDTGPALDIPFGWAHASGAVMPTAIQKSLDAWLNETMLYGKYLYDGTNGWKGQGVVTNLSMTSNLSSMNTFTFNLQGSGSMTAI